MKKNILIAICLLFSVMGMLVFTGCSSMRVGHAFDDKIKFSELKTYDWLPIENVANKARRKAVQSAIATRLEKKGFKRDEIDPDFLVTFYTDVQDVMDLRHSNYYYSDNYVSYSWDNTAIDSRHYQLGTLIIDCVDPGTHKLIWRGEAEDAIPEKTERLIKKVGQAIDKILKRFPPQ